MTGFEELSGQAERDGRLRNATSYLRVAEFFTPPRSPEKVRRYRRYRQLFHAAFGGGGVVRHDIPYAGAPCRVPVPGDGRRRRAGPCSCTAASTR